MLKGSLLSDADWAADSDDGDFLLSVGVTTCVCVCVCVCKCRVCIYRAHLTSKNSPSNLNLGGASIGGTSIGGGGGVVLGDVVLDAATVPGSAASVIPDLGGQCA